MTKTRTRTSTMSVVVAFMLMISFCLSFPAKDQSAVNAAAANYKFDFGGNGTANGYIGVSASDGYDSGKGYGFNQTYNVANSAAAGSGALSDSVVFKSTDRSNTFKVDLTPGLYKIAVYLGNTTRASVVAEDVLQLINLTGNNAVDTFTIPVTDGQLSLMVTEGKAGTVFSLSALEIEKISDDITTQPTIWICGDSTVCNYYPKDTAVRVGWAQMLDEYVSKDFMIRNLAASGQFAAGFVSAGQFEPVLKYGKKGDYYIISIGINDKNYSDEEEYYNVVTDMTKKAKEKGMTVILVKQQGRADDISRPTLLTGRWFGSQLDTIGKEQNVQVLDLFNLAQNYFLSIGQDKTNELYDSGDTLHFNRSGAKVLAKLVSENVDFRTGSDTPTVPVEPAEPEKPDTVTVEYIKGDMDNDESITVVDLIILKNMIITGEISSHDILSADIDENGIADMHDITELIKYLYGIDSSVTGQKLTAETEESITGDKNIYPAINATLYNAFGETINAGYKCSEYVNFNNETGSYAEWNTNVLKTGNYLVSFRIANGSESDRNMKIEVNNNHDNYWVQPFLTTGAWTTWEIRGIVLPLTAGTNIIRATSFMTDGGPNIDYIKLEPTDEPVAEIYQPESTDPVVPSENPVIYIAGDSTAQSYKPSYAPQQGWGYYLGNYFTSNVTVSNQAIAGRSSKSFYDNGRLDTILGTIKKGDYLLIQFGINDAASTKPERYAPVCGSAENPAEGSFEYYIAKYIEGASAKGATPVLVTNTLGLKAYSGGKFVGSYENYCNAMKNMASKYRIPCIDLNSIMVDHYNSIGYDAARMYHLYGVVSGSTDMTHFSESGADKVAGLVAGAIKKLNIDISAYLR